MRTFYEMLRVIEENEAVNINELLNKTVGHLEDGPVTFRYLKEGGPGEAIRVMQKDPAAWMAEYLTISKTRNVRWQTGREIDSTGGDLVRIWTEDLKGTPLQHDCDFVVWSDPDSEIGEDFVDFFSRL